MQMHPPKFDKTMWAPAVGVPHSMCRFSEKPEDLGQRRQHLGILQVFGMALFACTLEPSYPSWQAPADTPVGKAA